MTEKRFTYDKPLVAFSKGGINDNVTGETYEFTMDTVLDLLNALHEETLLLRLQLNSCSDQRDEFHRGARENANRVGKLEKENEQLKGELRNLRRLANELYMENTEWQTDTATILDA